ncbi:MAG: C45 family autoproteolytic acyltransferase/hydrolase, partial [Phycisphaerales bacterium]
MAVIEIGIRAIAGEGPEGAGASLRAVFAEYWPAYRAWIGRSKVRDPGECIARFREHMPELEGVFGALVESFRDEVGAGERDAVARLLTLWCPPRVVRACSQVVLDSDRGAVLVRSYDHHPRLFDGVVLRSDWGGVRVVAVTDVLWGALEGVNEHGLGIALAFGGRAVAGAGFAAPMIVRYVLQRCATVREARAALARLPVYMSYTFVVTDGSGAYVTAYCGPDRSARFVESRASSNHQGEVEWAAYCAQTRSVERLAALERLVREGGARDVALVRDAFLRAPLWRMDYARGSGTLYVSELWGGRGEVVLRWGGSGVG